MYRVARQIANTKPYLLKIVNFLDIDAIFPYYFQDFRSYHRQ